MTSNRVHACPACEYRRGTAGRPVPGPDGIICLDCGNSWKVFGNSGAAFHIEQAVSPPSAKSANNCASLLAPKHMLEDSLLPLKIQKPVADSKTRMGFTVLACAAIIIAALVVSGLIRHSSAPDAQRLSALRIGEVNILERRNSQGGRVLTVRGQVFNKTSTGQKIPKISIVLRQSDGHEVFRWYHQSPLSVLRAGKRMSFVSSVQYDNPQIVSAHAVFEPVAGVKPKCPSCGTRK